MTAPALALALHSLREEIFERLKRSFLYLVAMWPAARVCIICDLMIEADYVYCVRLCCYRAY